MREARVMCSQHLCQWVGRWVSAFSEVEGVDSGLQLISRQRRLHANPDLQTSDGYLLAATLAVSLKPAVAFSFREFLI